METISKTTLPVVSAGEVRRLNARLREAARGRAAIILLDQIGIDHGALSANQVRADLVLGVQACLVLQFLTGRPTILIAGLPRGQANPFAFYTDSVAISNLIHSYVNGGSLSIDRLLLTDMVVHDGAGRWDKLQDTLDQIRRFATANGLSRASDINAFTPEVYVMYQAGRSTATYARAMTRQDVLFGDTLMCGGHLWWADTETNAGTELSNPLGGEGLRSSATDGDPHLIGREVAMLDDPSAPNDLVLCDIVAPSDVAALEHLSPPHAQRVRGLRIRRSTDQDIDHDGSFDYAVGEKVGVGADPSQILSAVFALGDLLASVDSHGDATHAEAPASPDV